MILPISVLFASHKEQIIALELIEQDKHPTGQAMQASLLFKLII